MSSMKEKMISEYILKQTDFSKEENMSISKLKEGIKKLVGEEPAVQFKWEKDAMLNEVTGKSKEIKKIKSVNIIFTDDNNEFKSIEFLI
jgi:hypothetical protein